jgi:hypothetical protein
MGTTLKNVNMMSTSKENSTSTKLQQTQKTGPEIKMPNPEIKSDEPEKPKVIP